MTFKVVPTASSPRTARSASHFDRWYRSHRLGCVVLSNGSRRRGCPYTPALLMCTKWPTPDATADV